MQRHFTVTGFLSSQGCTLLHWHTKNRMWLPPGGHVEPNEEPSQAIYREIEEETGISINILTKNQPFAYDLPQQLPLPVTIMLENVSMNETRYRHQHIDFVYFTQPKVIRNSLPQLQGWQWVSLGDLCNKISIIPPTQSHTVAITEDVRILGIASIEESRKQEGTT